MTAPGSRRPGFDEPAPGVAAPPSVRVSAGGLVEVPVTLTNRAGAPRVYAVTALGVDAAWLPPPTRTAPVPPGASVVTVVPLRPGAGTVAGRYPIAVAVQALDPGAGGAERATAATALATVEVVVGAPGQLAVAIEPADASAVFGRRVTIEISNSGTLPELVHLDVREPRSARLRLDRGPVTVPPGGSVPVRGRLRVGRPRALRPPARSAYTVTVRGAGAPRTAEGSFTARPLFGPIGTKLGAIVAVVALWVALAVLFIPKLADSIRGPQSGSTAAAASGAPSGGVGSGSGSGGSGSGGSGSGSGGSGSGSGGSGSGGSGSGGSGSGSGGSGGSGAAPAGAGSVATVQLNGTVTGSAPSGVTVSLSPTSLADASAVDATGVGTAPASAGAAKLTPDALAVSTLPTVADRAVHTGADGAWSFAKVPAQGYYLVQFAKPGYQTQRFVINAAAAVAAQPLTVALSAGQGSLHGTVRSAGGGVLGGATVVITDGTNTLTTSSNSTGSAVGTWSVDGLSTPSTYVVSVSRPGLGTQSQLVSLTAGGSGTVDLTLTSGVATLTGRVSTLVGSHTTGLGGATVTATDGSVTRTASTVTTGNEQGSFTLPDLSLGRWSVLISAAGYQLQSRTITVRAGRAQNGLDATLSPATVTVTGTVSSASGPLVGAGLTLSGAADTYKQMSDGTGSFSIDGVAPGVYTLTAQYFGMDPVSETVTAVVGQPMQPAVLQLMPTVVQNTSTIQGYAGNAVSSGGAIGCTQDSAGHPVLGCWVGLHLLDSDGNVVATKLTDTGTPSPTSTENASMTGPTPYTLSSADGLAPGRYQLTISSPGFIPAIVTVRVGLDSVAAAPQVGLYPGNSIAGIVGTTGGGHINGDGQSSAQPEGQPGANCVLAVPLGYKATAGFDPSTFTCADTAAVDPLEAACTSNGTASPGYAIIQNDGSYSISGLCDGRYTVRVVVGNSAYDASSVQPVEETVSHGQTLQYSPHLARYGVLSLTVDQLDSNTGATSAVPAGTPIDLACSGGEPSFSGLTTDATGAVRIFGFAPSDPQAPPNCKITSGTGKGALTGNTGGLQFQDDTDTSVTSTLTTGLDPLFGQVVTHYGSGVQPAAGVQLQIVAVAGYSGTTPNTVIANVTTDAHGCFAIVPTDTAAGPLTGPAGTQCPDPLTAGGDPLVSHVLPLDITSKLVSISTLGGNITLPFGAQPVTLGPASAAAVTQLSVPARPASTVGLTLTSDPAGLPLAGATVQLAARTADGSGTITAGVNIDGQLTWQDSNIPAPDSAWPGSYTLQVSVPGFTAGFTTTLTCGLVAPTDGGPSCSLSPSTIGALGELTGTVLAPSPTPPHTGTVPVANATVIATLCGDSAGACPTPPPATSACPTAGAGTRFTTTTDSAGGYDFIASSGRYLPPGYYQLVTCAPGEITTTLSDVRVLGGPGNSQDVTMSLLGGVSGTVTGSTDGRPLTGVTVTLLFCASSPCTQTAQTTTDAGGGYVFSGAAGRYFLDPGDWELSFAQPGYDTHTAPFTVSTGDTVISPTLTALGGLAGTVTSSLDGTPVTGATVTLVQCSSATSCPASGGTTTKTDNSGAYRFTGTAGIYFMDPGPWQITVRASGFGQLVKVLTIGNGDNDGSEQLVPYGALSGSVVDNLAGSAVPSATVTAVQCSDGAACTATTASSSRSVVTDSSGAFSFFSNGSANVLQPGYWQLSVTAAGYTAAPVVQQILGGANTAQLTVSALGGLSGTVTGTGAGTQQLSGATVTATPCDATGSTCTGTPLTATTNASGHYAFGTSAQPWALPPGTWQLTATAFGYTLAAPSVINVASGPNTADLQLAIKHVTQRIGVQIAGTSSLTTHAVVTIAPSDDQSQQSPVPPEGGTSKYYSVADLVPTSYSVTVTGDSSAVGQSILPIVVTIVVPLSDTGTVPPVTVPVSVVHGSITGAVSRPAGAASTADISGISVQLMHYDGTSYTPARDAADNLLDATTASDGTWSIGGVPNGTYYVQVNGPDPVTGATPADGFQEIPPASPVTVAYGVQNVGTVQLAQVLQTVRVSVAVDTADDISAATPTITTADAGASWPAMSPTSTTSSGGTRTYTFLQVPAGCWTFVPGLPTGHPGTVGLGSGAGSCAKGFAVSPSQTATEVDPSYTLDEHVLTLQTAISTNGVDTVTPAVTATVTAGTTTSTYPVADGTTTIYLRGGKYTVALSSPAAPVLWPMPAAQTADLTTSSKTISWAVTEAAFETLTVQPDPTAAGAAATVRLKCLQQQDAPTGCATLGSQSSSMTTKAVQLTDLAPGDWYVQLSWAGTGGKTVTAHQTVTLSAGGKNTATAAGWLAGG